MELKIENTLENNRLCLDKMYREAIIKLPEKIDHVQTLTSIAKMGLKPFTARCNSTNAFRLLMECQEPEYSEGKTYDKLRTKWLPGFLKNNVDWIDKVCRPFVASKGQDWDEFINFIVEPDYKCDEVGIFLFARMYHIHVAVIVNDRVWTTHYDHKLTQCSIVLGYRGCCEFVLLRPKDVTDNQEIEFPVPIDSKPKTQRKPLDLSAATIAKKKALRKERRKKTSQFRSANRVLNKYKLRSKKRTTRNSNKTSTSGSAPAQYTDIVTPKGTLRVAQHGLVKPKKRSRSYSCYWCNKKFPFHKELNAHILADHPGQGFHCRYCGQDFQSFSGRYKHMMIHIGYKYKCATCSSVFRYPYELRDHEKVHTKLGLFPCKDCAKSYTTTKALGQHQQIHSEDTFTCDSCEKVFKTKGYLQQHFRVHDKNFIACCGKKCKNPTDRQKHQHECGKCAAKKKKFREV